MPGVFIEDFKKNNSRKAVPMKYPSMISLFSLILCLGCSANHTLPLIDSFSDATVDFTEKATKVYELIEESTIERKIIEIATQSNEDIEQIDRDTFADLSGILEENDALGVRKEVLSLLGKYAEALGELSMAEMEDEIKEASRDLYSALIGLDTTGARVLGRKETVGHEHIKMISTEINALGMAITRGKRIEGIKKVVLQSDSTIQLACELLSEDIALLAELAMQSLDTEITEWIRLYKIRAPKLSFEQRIKLAKKVYGKEKMMIEAEHIFSRIGEASKKVGMAHSALKDALIRNKPSSKDLLIEIQELLNLTLVIDEFYESLE